MKIKNHKIFFGKFSAENLVKKFGSPLYVYEEEILKEQYESLIGNITYKPLKIYYAVKANSNIEIMKLFRKMGAGAETVSRGEVLAALKAGFKPENIAYTCSNISREEFEWVVRKGITVNVDSLLQLEWFGKMKPGGEVSIRINRGVGAGYHEHWITGGPESKFGIYYGQLKKIVKLVQMYKLRVTGLHQHIGSNILDEKIFIKATEALLKTAKNFKQLEFLDFGGGFGVPYRPSEKGIDMESLGPKLTKVFTNFNKKYGKKLEYRFEPGRYLVAQAGYLLAEVVDLKETPGNKFVGLKVGMNSLIRPAMYGSYHEIINASSIRGRGEKMHIAGFICESGDVFAKRRVVVKPQIGDVMAFLTAGAYGYTMSSNYNLRPRPAEVLIDSKGAKLIRSAEKEEDLI